MKRMRLAPGTPGSLDFSFGAEGVRTWRPKEEVYAIDSVLLSDTRILSVFTDASMPRLIFVKHHGNGTIDTSFGEGGVSYTARIADNWSFHGNVSLTASPTHAYVAAIIDHHEFDHRVPVVARCTLDGQLDTSFGVNGVFYFDFVLPLYEGAFTTEVRLDDQQRPIVLINNPWGTTDKKGFVARLDLNGNLDASYGKSGIAAIPDGSTNPRSHVDLIDLAVLPDGSAVVSQVNLGEQPEVIPVVRKVSPAGQPDRDFGEDGVALVNVRFLEHENNAGTLRVHVQPNDDAVLCFGWAATNDPMWIGAAMITRFTPDGASDETFHDGVPVITKIPGNTGFFTHISAAVQADGKIVVSGVSLAGSPPATTLMRFLPDGRLDDSFGQEGIALLIPAPGIPELHKLYISEDSRTVLALGQTDSDLFLARFHL